MNDFHINLKAIQSNRLKQILETNHIASRFNLVIFIIMSVWNCKIKKYTLFHRTKSIRCYKRTIHSMRSHPKYVVMPFDNWNVWGIMTNIHQRESRWSENFISNLCHFFFWDFFEKRTKLGQNCTAQS